MGWHEGRERAYRVDKLRGIDSAIFGVAFYGRATSTGRWELYRYMGGWRSDRVAHQYGEAWILKGKL